MTTAIIGGTGLADFAGLDVEREHAVSTPFGATSTAIREGRLEGASVLFLHRHGGRGKPVPPHLVNYRANLWALRELGAQRIIAANAVGAIDPELTAGTLVLPDQLIDYTWGREHTFDEGEDGHLLHVDFTEPFDCELRDSLVTLAASASVPCANRGVLAVVQGPRLETAAEVQRLARDGCALVGMTTMPEAGLARELGIPYVSVCMVVNAAAGIADAPISLEAIRETLEAETRLFARLVQAYLRAVN